MNADELTFDIDIIEMTMEDGTEQEFAVLDDFEFEDKKYLVVSMIVNNEIEEDFYIYGYREEGDDLIIDYIEDDDEYNRIGDAYAQLCEEDFAEDEEEEFDAE